MHPARSTKVWPLLLAVLGCRSQSALMLTHDAGGAGPEDATPTPGPEVAFSVPDVGFTRADVEPTFPDVAPFDVGADGGLCGVADSSGADLDRARWQTQVACQVHVGEGTAFCVRVSVSVTGTVIGAEITRGAPPNHDAGDCARGLLGLCLPTRAGHTDEVCLIGF